MSWFLKKALPAFFTLLLTGTVISAQDFYYVGSNGIWDQPSNWSSSPNGPGGSEIPSELSNVFIETTSSIDFTSSEEIQVVNITISCPQVSSSVAWGVSGDMTINSKLRAPLIVLNGQEPQHIYSTQTLDCDVEITNQEIVILDSHLLLSPSRKLSLKGNLDANGKVIAAGVFEANDSHTYLNLAGSKVVVQQRAAINDNIQNQGQEPAFWLAGGAQVNASSFGQFAHTTQTNRTSACGNDPGQTPFTIDAAVISDFNGFEISCNDAEDGEAFVSVTGGVGPFAFTWIGGGTNVFTQNYPGLGPGTYTVVVEDIGQGISCVDNVQLTEPAPLTIFTFSQTPPSCEGLCNGSASPTIIGGVPGYDYNWSNSETTASAFALCEGTNTLTVIDQNGCELFETFETELNPIVANLTIEDVLCNGTATGSVISSPSGGTGGYNYAWSNLPDSDNTIENQPPGTVTLTITDSSGCSVDTTFTIEEEPPIEVLEDLIIDESCPGNFDGSASIIINGGTPDYTTSWTSPLGFTSSEEDISGLEAATYSVVVEDDNGCFANGSFIVDAPPTLDVTEDVTPVSCFNGTNGSISISVNGGTPNYTYVWTDGFPNSPTVSDLTAGTYDVEILDEGGCSELLNVEVNEPAEIVITATSTPISCFSAADGAINIEAAGGTPEYNFDWNGPAFASTDQNISNLPPGIYELTVIDEFGCEGTYATELTEPEAIDIQTDLIPISCPGNSDASIITTITGVAGPFDFIWTADNGFNTTEQNISDLAPGVYELEVTNAQGCTSEATVVINELDPLTIIPNVTEVSCGGLSDGAIDLSVLGGTPDYEFLWAGPNTFGSTDEDVFELEAGVYTVEITDLQGCQTVTDIDVNEPPTLSLIINSNEISCFNADDASIDLDISGGQGPYNISWAGPDLFTSNEEDLLNLEPGTYNVLVIDQNSCFEEGFVSFIEPEEITVDIASENTSCFGLNDGSITLTLSGGVEPYTTVWSHGLSDAALVDLSAGVYSATITDDDGCQIQTGDITLEDPPEIIIEIDASNIICAGNSNGIISTTIDGGSGTLSVAWTGPNGFTSNQLVLSGLEAGRYDIEITDENDCVQTASVEIEEPTPLGIDPTISPMLCADDLIDVSVLITGGQEPYTLLWSGPNTFTSDQTTITNLEQGMYSLEVTDGQGCFISQDFDLFATDPLTANTEATPLDCSGNDSGIIETIISGGTPDYSVSWNGPSGFASSDELITDLAAGTYNLTVTDLNGCEVLIEETLDEPLFLALDATLTAPLCSGENTGAINTIPSGGDGNFNYNWTGPNVFGSVAEDITNLLEGTYILNLTDGSGCSLDTTFLIESNQPVEVDPVIQNETCSGQNNGLIDLVITGGLEPYTIAWTGPEGYTNNGENIEGLMAGDYNFSITDDNGCDLNGTLTIAGGAEIVMDVNALDASCNEPNGSAAVVVSGGQEPYDIVWTDDAFAVIVSGDSVSDLSSGVYFVEATDNNGCRLQQSVTISDSDVIEISGTETPAQCAGDFNGTIQIDVIGGTGALSYDWSGPNVFTSNQEDVADLEAGNYVVQITDELGCQTAEQFEVTEPEVLTVSGDAQNISCFGENDGRIDVAVSGGTADYTLVWSGPNTFSSDQLLIDNLGPGNYLMSITDAQGCSASYETEITEDSELQLSETHSNTLCFGEINGFIDLTIDGGQTPYDISWTAGGIEISTNEDLNGLSAGTYAVDVSDSNGCSSQLELTIIENEELTVSFDQQQPACLSNDGEIEAILSGGSGDYNYFWYDLNNGNALIATDPLVTNLTSGNYFFEGFDGGGCSVTGTVLLSDAIGGVDLTSTPVLCFGDSNGTIASVIEGAVEPYTIEWTGPNTFTSDQENITDLEAGDYTLQITDALGCLFGDAITVESPNDLIATPTTGNPLCPGEETGVINLSVTGGTETITINWQGPNGFASEETNLMDLEEGCYDYTVTDFNNCTATSQACVEAPETIESMANITNVDCFGEDTGNIELLIQGGAGGYSTNWAGPNSFVSEDLNLTDLAAGQYDVQITDLNSCVLDTFFVVTENTSIDLEVLTVPPTCHDSNNAELKFTTAGGIEPYGTLVDGPDGFSAVDQNQLTSLVAGEYLIQVTDALGCFEDSLVTIDAPDSLVISGTPTNVLCVGQNDGNIAIEIEGGIDPLSFAWTGPNMFISEDQNITDLEPGSYEVVVQDAFLCEITAQYQIEEAVTIEITLDDVDDSDCIDSNEGFISVTASGGLPDYQYVWTGPDFFTSEEQDITDLFPGFYTLEVTDANGCSESLEDVEIIGLGDVEAIAPADTTWCFGLDVVLLGTNTGGDSEGWTLEDGTQISDSAETVVNFEPGVYTLIYFATDGPCLSQDQVTIEIYEAAFADAGEDQFVFEEETAVLGGDEAAPLNSSTIWSPGISLNDSIATNPETLPVFSSQIYVLNVISENGCLATDTVEVNVIPQISIPDGFTPNGDGMNDTWELGNIAFYPSASITIFNRWGEELFFNQGYTNIWDGMYQGNPLPIGTYYYVIRINESEFQSEITGPVTILR